MIFNCFFKLTFTNLKIYIKNGTLAFLLRLFVLFLRWETEKDDALNQKDSSFKQCLTDVIT